MYNKPYRGSRHKRKRRVFTSVLLVSLLLILLFALSFIFFQNYIVFDKEGVKINFSFSDILKKSDDKPNDKTNEQLDSNVDDNFTIVDDNQNNINDSTNQINPNTAQALSNPKTIYIPASSFSNADIVQDILALHQKGMVNTVSTDLKSLDGILSYNTSIDYLSQFNNIASTATQFESNIKALIDNGIKVTGRISCFRDNTFAQNMKDAAIKTSSGVTWLDYKNNRHLNPYSDVASNYISDIIKEAANLGFSEIILSDLSFPTDGKLSYISYGNPSSSKTEKITELFTNFSNLGKSLNVDLSLEYNNAGKEAGQDLSALYPLAKMIYIPASNQSEEGKQSIITSLSALTNGETSKLMPINTKVDYFKTVSLKTDTSYYLDLIENNYTLKGLY